MPHDGSGAAKIINRGKRRLPFDSILNVRRSPVLSLNPQPLIGDAGIKSTTESELGTVPLPR
jgi:hypothetical protein